MWVAGAAGVRLVQVGDGTAVAEMTADDIGSDIAFSPSSHSNGYQILAADAPAASLYQKSGCRRAAARCAAATAFACQAFAREAFELTFRANHGELQLSKLATAKSSSRY